MGKSESQMDIMEKSSKSGKRRWTFAEIGLSVLLLLVSCALAGLIVLYTSIVKEQSTKKSVSRSSTGEGQLFRSGHNSVCTTADCVTAAARLLQNMDDSVKPCDNFYQYACGGWLERHVIPETSSRHSVFDILRDKLEIVLKGVLETENGQDRNAIKKAKVLYNSCMNEKEAWSLEDTLAKLTARFHKKALLDMYVWTDDRDSRRHIIYIDQPGLGMPSRDYYFNDGNYKKVREAYLHFMVSIAKITREDRNLTQDEDRVWEEMMQVLELETDIANATSPAEERQDVTVLYYKTTLGELQSTFSFNGFNWTQFIQGVLSSASVELKLEEEVVVYSSPYLEKMNNVLPRHSVRTMQNYLAWQLIIDRVNSLSRRFKDARARYRKTLYGTTVEDAWWRECVRYVQSSMENAVGALYVRETFAGESKQMVSDLIGKIQKAYVETLEELSWMDSPSKEKAREKAMAIKEHIGYPDHILQETNLKLDQEYAHLNFSEEYYFENILENLKSDAHKSLKKLREPVDPDLWIIGAAVVNAFYSPNRNQIVFPAGILQPPFFSKQQHQALNFGGIGMVIGHEITHGFDDNGRNFDRDGNMLNWWSNYSAEHFKEQSKCMVQQYGNFNWKLAGGQNVSGISTLGENIADNGGVRQAFKAYLKLVETEGEEPRLPGLDMDHKQLFFLNFAQVWCGAYRPEYASQSIKTDSHSPWEYRVLGSLQNFEAFSEAFQCQKGSKMNPKQKCRVW
uniref:Membrane metallo-endopeptidase-like 1 n=1 Tax=Gasterosteus aculeatus aculeatus TaxID=481459 RepID=G3NX91_GASAC